MDNRTRILYEGDNIQFLQSMEDESVDLIATDPPYNKNKKFQGVGASAGQELDDTWSWTEETYRDVLQQLDEQGYRATRAVVESAYYAHSPSMAAFITFMSARAIHFHRLLKPTGSLYLQCDSTASAYLKAMLDSIFGNGENGKQGFRNEIVWKRNNAGKGNGNEKRFGVNSDRILFYTKGNKYPFNVTKNSLALDDIDKKFNRIDDNGRRFRTDHIEANDGLQGGGSNYTYNGYTPKRGWLVNESSLQQMDIEGRLYWSSTGKPYRKYFADEYKGMFIDDIWLDIARLSSVTKERTGWATQKPVALYRRIIETSSNEGDLVLDPFAGCATTCVAAEQLGRSWIGIDISPKLRDIGLKRMEKECNNLFGGDVIFATSVDG